MKFYVFVVLSVIGLQETVIGQNCKRGINHAISAICKNDTQSYLRCLRRASLECKDHELLLVSYLLQSKIMEERMDYDTSIELLNKALEVYTGPVSLRQFNDKCDWIYNTFGPYLILNKGEINLNLAKVYLKKSDFKNAIACLNLINKSEIPGYNGCVNGAIAIESSLAIQYAACYLGLGDSTSAIKSLVEYSLFDEGEVSKKLLSQLKELLLQKYSKREIIAEIDNSISNVKELMVVDKNGFGFNKVEFILFGKRIPYLPFSLIEFKKFIRNNHNIEFLKA